MPARDNRILDESRPSAESAGLQVETNTLLLDSTNTALRQPQRQLKAIRSQSCRRSIPEANDTNIHSFGTGDRRNVHDTNGLLGYGDVAKHEIFQADEAEGISIAVLVSDPQPINEREAAGLMVGRVTEKAIRLRDRGMQSGTTSFVPQVETKMS